MKHNVVNLQSQRGASLLHKLSQNTGTELQPRYGNDSNARNTRLACQNGHFRTIVLIEILKVDDRVVCCLRRICKALKMILNQVSVRINLVIFTFSMPFMVVRNSLHSSAIGLGSTSSQSSLCFHNSSAEGSLLL
ncbi:hypothetical protein AVEN_57481-1 [Araneus ventricosus]|uniref:Uncharacterized protein n=1 Tax=Araneus ventricosus TaxID=182803 RepID=A0A4Y2CX31_ARAVE|nr:hypothetical protein AVEN_57481-1 [Araneus ventricosus]